MAKTQAEQLLESVGTLLQLFTVNEERFPSAEGRMRYNPIDFQTLRFVHAHSGCRGIDAAKALGVAPTTVQSSLDRLIRNGLIDRKPHAVSKRAKAHFLTEEGQSVRAAIHRQDISNMETMLGVLSPDERASVIEALNKVVANLNQDAHA
nr:MarR family winged helix-turn-helix transcriptional regulator [Hyphomonas sp. Mor2]